MDSACLWSDVGQHLFLVLLLVPPSKEVLISWIDPIMTTTTSSSTATSSTTGTYANLHPEYVAVVLACTTGARLFPLTSSVTAQQPLPKHLLPLAGIPALERLLTGALADFSQVFIAIAADDQVTVPTVLEDANNNGGSLWEPADTTASMTMTTTTTTTVTTPSPDPTTVTFPQPHSVWKPKATSLGNQGAFPERVTVVRMPEECPGSAEVLRQLEGLLPSRAHVLVVPGDLVVTQASTTIAALLHAHRQGQQQQQQHDGMDRSATGGPAACTLLLHDVGEQDEQGVPLKESAKQKKGGLARDAEEIEYMALAFGSKSSSSSLQQQRHHTARLIWKQGKMDAEQDEDFTLTGQTPKLRLPKARLRPSGVVKVRSDWNDLHVYVLAPWVVRLVQAKTSIVSLQRDLLPLLIRRQFLGKVETFGQGVESHRVLEILEEDREIALGSTAAPTTSGLLSNGNNNNNNALSNKDANAMNTTTTSTALMKPNQTYSVLAHVGTGAMRSSSLAAYLYASKDLLHKLVDPNKPQQLQHAQDSQCLRLPAQSTINPKLVSLLLSDAQVGDKPTLKASIVGTKCRLGKKCRLNNVILMDNVQLGDNVVLQNTIVAKGAVIGDNCSLNDCQVAAGVKVESGTKEKGEALVDTLSVIG